MTTFTRVKLGSICDVRDGTHDSPKESKFGYPLVTSKHIKNRRVDLNETYLISENDFNQINKRSKVDRWDILFSMIGTVGEIAFVKNDEKYAIKNVGLIKTDNEILGKYLFYYLWSPQAKRDLESLLSGSTQKFISLGKLRDFPIFLPPEADQSRISSILSSYDDMIENNEKRIKALEEMAQLLYFEWFVKPVKNGLPQGWRTRKLGELVENIHTSTKAGTHLENRQYIPIENISRKSFVLRESTNWKEAQSSLVLFEKNDILFGAMRPYFHKVAIASVPGVTRTTCLVLRAKENIFRSLALLTIFSDSFISLASASTKGATIPYSAWENSLENYKVSIPDEDILIKFNKKLGSIISQLVVLVSQNNNLSETRNLLIPQLVTGKRELK